MKRIIQLSIILLIPYLNTYGQLQQLIQNSYFQNGENGKPNASEQIEEENKGCYNWYELGGKTCDWYSTQSGYLNGRCPNDGGQFWNTNGDLLPPPPSGSNNYAGCGGSEIMANKILQKIKKGQKIKLQFSYAARMENPYQIHFAFNLRDSVTGNSFQIDDFFVRTVGSPGFPKTHEPCIWYTYESGWVEVGGDSNNEDYDSFFIGGGSQNAAGGELYSLTYIYIGDVYLWVGDDCCIDDIVYQNQNNIPELTHVRNTIQVKENVNIQSGNYTLKAGESITLDPYGTFGQSGTINIQDANVVLEIEDCNPETYPTMLPVQIDFSPNVITPNGDGYNDELCFFVQNATEYEVQIFDRFGLSIYQGSGVVNSNEACVWDGLNNNGNLVNPGVVYYFIVTFSNCSSSETDASFFHVFYSQNTSESQNVTVEQMVVLDSIIIKQLNNESEEFKENTIVTNNIPNNESECKAPKLKIYPNPTNGILNIQSEGFLEQDEIVIEIFDNDYKLVMEETKRFGSEIISINVENLASGYYKLKLSNKYNQIIKPFVKVN